jgi:hypothetical protein
MRFGDLARRLAGGALLCVGMIQGAALVTAPASAATFKVTRESWSEADERGYMEFIEAIGNAKCNTVDRCMKSAANPFARTDPPGTFYAADCADLPYFLRAYYAWKRGLPFSYAAAVSPRGATRDIRYTASGNTIVSRRNVLTGTTSGLGLLLDVRNGISSAMFRLHPDMEDTDLYPVRMDRKAVKPGTVLYDPNGHVAIVYKVEDDGRILFIDSHPDNTLTRGTYGKKFVRSYPGMGAGFKNWRPLRLVGATRSPDGTLQGGRIEFARNSDLEDFSTEQFFGNVNRPADRQWQSGQFQIDGQAIDYYDFVRARMGNGSLVFEPLQEVRNMVRANCEDLRYRAEAVDIAIRAGIQNKPQPGRLPQNIYGTQGEWEDYSTPSRDARLKASFQELYDQVERFVEWHATGDKRVKFEGRALAAALLAAYDQEAAACTLSYVRSNGASMSLTYEQMRKRLFLMSFDPYHCIERRWGATDAAELATCRDDTTKASWYAAQQGLRNQIDRTYEARMDFSLEELKAPGPGRGPALPPDVDVRSYLQRMIARQSRLEPARPQIAPAGTQSPSQGAAAGKRAAP